MAWSWIARQSTPFQALLPAVMNAEISERAVYFFNAKQIFLWLAGGQGLVGTANTYVSSVVSLLVYSEVLHVFKSALLFYFMFFDAPEPQDGAGIVLLLKQCCANARTWLCARWAFVALGMVALALFIADEVSGGGGTGDEVSGGGGTSDALKLAALVLTMAVELGGDAALAARMMLSRIDTCGAVLVMKDLKHDDRVAT